MPKNETREGPNGPALERGRSWRHKQLNDGPGLDYQVSNTPHRVLTIRSTAPAAQLRANRSWATRAGRQERGNSDPLRALFGGRQAGTWRGASVNRWTGVERGPPRPALVAVADRCCAWGALALSSVSPTRPPRPALSAVAEGHGGGGVGGGGAGSPDVDQHARQPRQAHRRPVRLPTEGREWAQGEMGKGETSEGGTGFGFRGLGLGLRWLKFRKLCLGGEGISVLVLKSGIVRSGKGGWGFGGEGK